MSRSRTYVFRCAAERCCPGRVVAHPFLRQPEVRQANVAVMVQKNILGFKVPKREGGGGGGNEGEKMVEMKIL